jgi:predicted transcriptional regulator of viral defense system
LQRLGGGDYLLNPAREGPEAIPETNPYRVGSHLVSPAYFGYGTAANLHGLLTQVFRTCFLVSLVRKKVSISQPTDYRIVHVSQRKFFGSTSIEKYGSWIQVSDLEKTVLDCVDRPAFAGGIPGVVQIISAAKPRLDYQRLRDYAKRVGNRSLVQRLGFFLKLVRPNIAVPPSFEAFLRRLRGDSFVLLGSPKHFGRTGKLDRQWRVIVNLSDPRLFGEVQVG